MYTMNVNKKDLHKILEFPLPNWEGIRQDANLKHELRETEIWFKYKLLDFWFISDDFYFCFDSHGG